jgi:aminoglycoside/choline kinase family phosphotransferase
MRLEDSGAIKYFKKWAESDRVMRALADGTRVIHGDFKADQIFMAEDGYRVTDWQRPVRAPADVDLVSLLVDRHISPHGIVDNPVIGIYWFLRLHWVVTTQHDLFPQNHWPIYSQYATEALEQIRLCQTR